MSVEQKDLMQLFGQWGYSADELEKRWNAQRRESEKSGDEIGRLSYMQLLTMARFAKSGNAIESVKTPDNKPSEPNEILESIINIFNFQDEEECQNLLNSIYKMLSPNKTLEEGEIYTRQYTFNALVPLVIQRVIKIEDNITRTIQQCIVDIAMIEYEQEHEISSGNAINQWAIKRFDQQKERMLAYRALLCELPSKIHPDHAKLAELLANTIFADLPKCFDVIGQSLLSAAHSEPHEMMEYGKSYGMICAAVTVAVSMGQISYSEYRKTMLNILVDEERFATPTERIDDIERLRSN